MPAMLLWTPERSGDPARGMCRSYGVGADREGRVVVPKLRSVLR